MKVRSIIAQGDALVPFLQPLLIPDRDVPIESFVAQLKHALTYSPQFVRVFASLGQCFECEGRGKLEETKWEAKGDRKVERIIERICPHCRGSDSQEQIHGFMIAYAPEGMSYVFISQTYVHPKASEEHLAELYLSKLRAWAESQGKRSIRAETPRNPLALTRKYGFKTLSTIVELRLDEEVISDGKEQRSEIGIDIDEEPTGVERSVDQPPKSLDGDEDRDRSDVLQSTDRAQSDVAVSAGVEPVGTGKSSTDTAAVGSS